jgi:uncharacterized protein YaiL (DUF2058 family)
MRGSQSGLQTTTRRVEIRDLRLRSDVDLDKALRLAAKLEDAESVRKLKQGR